MSNEWKRQGTVESEYGEEDGDGVGVKWRIAIPLILHYNEVVQNWNGECSGLTDTTSKGGIGTNDDGPEREQPSSSGGGPRGNGGGWAMDWQQQWEHWSGLDQERAHAAGGVLGIAKQQNSRTKLERRGRSVVLWPRVWL
ncbi:hypothetical protein NL676_038512 [Syzygium grande]|nr:hypothetical protein NL676_038512 [Syzygium grande]